VGRKSLVELDIDVTMTSKFVGRTCKRKVSTELNCQFFNLVQRIGKVTTSFVMSVCLPVRLSA
jgi:hypothetical protein